MDMPDLWSDLLACLDLRERPAAGRSGSGVLAAGSRRFEGRSLRLGQLRRVFGGQLLAQFVRAASVACPDKAVKSLHVLFAREGQAAEPLCYEVECHHQGRSFATLTIVARQGPAVVATASVSMHAAEKGRERQTVPLLPAVPGEERRVALDLIPWETRSSANLDSPAASRPELDLWMRTPEIDPALAPALTAYATDLSLIDTALRPFDGVSQRDAGTVFTSAVTSHTLWFHRPFSTDRWLLLRQHSPLLAHGRCFGRGDVLTENGVLIASYAQEALLRFTPSP
jgi:acyl-CoA thioesterase-2